MLLAGAAAAVILLTVPPKGTDNFRQEGIVLQGGQIVPPPILHRRVFHSIIDPENGCRDKIDMIIGLIARHTTANGRGG